MNLFFDTSALVKLYHKETGTLSHQWIAIDYFVACDKRLLNFAKKHFNTFNPEIESI